jgi:hypothetical protein
VEEKMFVIPFVESGSMLVMTIGTFVVIGKLVIIIGGGGDELGGVGSGLGLLVCA